MWRFSDLSLQNKISLIVVAGLASAIVITVANFISFDRRNVERDLREEMRVLARITAARSAVALAFGDRVNALENLESLSLRSTIQHACIYNSVLTLFAQYQRKHSRYPACASELDAAEGDSKLIKVVEPIFRKGSRLGYVLVASDYSPVNSRTKKWVFTSFFVAIIATFLAFLITRQLQRAVVGPIINLSRLMDQVRSSNDLSLRAQAAGSDEVGRLVDSFNEMLEIVERHNRDLETLYRELVVKSAEAESTAAALEVSNQQIKEQFGGAAHDLKQPLQAMSIFVDTLKRKIKNPEQLEIVAKLKQATQNLSALFTEILDVSNYEFDWSRAETQTVEINPLLNKLYSEFEVLAAQKGLKLRFRAGDYKVIAHGALLERILRNLLSNAIRYTERGGILLGCRRRGRRLAIEIWDTGRGIPEQKQKTIFSRFVQADESDREKFGGFGMGLAIVKQFVDSLGYHLSLRSKVNRGSVFRLLVPLEQSNILPSSTTSASPEVAQQPIASLTEHTMQGMHEHQQTRILLLDDDSTVRGAIKTKLLEWGFSVDDFGELAAMLGFYRQGGARPSLMISDYQLADGNTGDQAIAAMRELLRCELPAFIISASDDEQAWHRIRDAGFLGLKKPLKSARFRAMINHLLQ